MYKGRIVVYAADTMMLKNPSVFAAGYAKVPRYRQEKIDRFLFQKDKILSLAAELLLQQCLKEHGILSYQIRYGKYGKPYLQNCVYKDGAVHPEKMICFNLSHSEERVLCTLSDMEVGCDVEKVRDIELDVAKHYFSKEEYESIAVQKTKDEQTALFFRYWTIKESYMKATGMGIAHTPGRFRLNLEGEELGYHFKEYNQLDGYRYAVCGQRTCIDDTIRWIQLTI